MSYYFQSPKSFRRFATRFFLIGKINSERKKAGESINSHLEKMRKSIIKMRLSYKDIDLLKDKIENFVHWERTYSKFFKPEDKEKLELRAQINALEQELRDERKEKERIISENNEKVRQLTESLNDIKRHMGHLHLEKAKRQQRLKALEQKITEKVDIHRYYQP